MAKKTGKRKLKKSVRRGCLGIMLLIALYPAFLMYRCSRRNAGNNETACAYVVLEPDSVDLAIAEKLATRVTRALRIDTARMGISVYDIERNCLVYEYHSHMRLIPASCMKLPTAIMALHYLGTDHKYESRLLIDGDVENGTVTGNIIMDMDDDPLIETFDDFAQTLAERDIRNIEGNINLLLSRTDTLRQHHTAKPWDIPYNKVPLLMKGEPRIHKELAASMKKHGIRYRDITSDSTDCGGKECLLTVTHPLRKALAPMLINSSNIKAECVSFHTRRLSPAAEDTQNFIQTEIPYNDTDGFVINDGSGLSPENRLTTDFLVQLMAYAYRREEIRDILINETLATPAHPTRRGSLLSRMTKPTFRNRIFCKTGTIATIGASSLTGYALNENGRWFAFSIINENSPVAESRIFQDLICSVLVSMP